MRETPSPGRWIPTVVLLGVLLGGCCGSDLGAADDGPTTLVLVTRCAGFDSGAIEDSVTVPLEALAAGEPAVAGIESLTTDDASVVTLTLTPGADPLAAQSALLDRLADASGLLPVSCDATTLGRGGAGQRIAVRVAVGGDWPLVEAAAEDLRLAWLAVPGVDQVRIEGLAGPRVKVTVDSTRTAALGVSPVHVRAAVQTLGLPTIPEAGMPAALAVDELGDLPIGSPPEVAPQLRDLADIEVDRVFDCGRIWLDGTPVAVVTAVVADGSPVTGPDPISTALDDWVAGAPPGVQATRLDTAPLVVTALGDISWLDDQLSAVERSATEAGAERTLLHLSVPRADALECDPTSGTALVSAWWPGEPPATARTLLRRAIRRIPAATGHVAAPGDVALRILVSAPDGAGRDALADTVVDRLGVVPDLLDVRSEQPMARPELKLRADRERLAAFGLRESDVTDAVLLATEGTSVGEIVLDGRRAPVVVLVGGVVGSEDGLSALGELGLLLADGGATIPVAQVAEIELTARIPEQRRVDLEPVTPVYVRIQPGGEALARERIVGAMAEIALPEGAWIRLTE
jgi:multidrug efflux pump subunit AcrB